MTKQVATIHTSIWPRGHFIWAVVILASLAIVVGSAWPTSLAAQNHPSPDTPDRPTGTAVFVGGVDLGWNEVSGAESYEVQLYRNARWNDLPGDGVDIAFYGAGAIISGLNHTGFSYYFQVRANNAYGTSDWSEYLLMSSTSEYTSGKRDRPGNVPATGAPTVSGTAQEGETLTADTSGIADENGLDRVKFYYQWVSGEGAAAADIAGATGSSYTLANADAGKAVNVRVSFTDRGGYAESRSSAATGVVTPTPPPPTPTPTPEPAASICDRTQQVRDAILAKLPDVNDCSAVTADDLSSIAGRLGLSRTNIAALQGVDFHGLSSLEYLNIRHNDLSELPDGVFDGLSSLADLRLYGNELSALPDGVFDGLSSLEHLNIGRNGLSALPGGMFEGLSSLEHLYLYGNELSALPDGVFEGLSALEVLLLNYNDLSALPDGVFDNLSSLEYLHLYENDLSALPDGVFDGLSNLYELNLSGNPGAPFTITAELEQQADYAFVVKIAEGTPFDMKVTLSFQGAAQEGATVTVEGGSVRSLPISVTPSETGQPRATVSVESAVFKNPRVYFMVDVSYPYYATGVETGLGDDLILPGESENTPATGAPSISGTAQVGETLTADTSGIADADGLSGVTFSYQWLSSRDTEIQGATGATYTLVAADAGKTIKVRVSFTDAAGNAESLTSAATAAVAQEEPTEPPPPQNLTATVNEDGSLTLNWEAPDDDSVTGYRVLRRRPSEGEKTLLVYVADTESTATTYTDTGVAAGIQHVYRVQAVNAAGAGEQSNYVNVTPAQPEPEPDQNAPATGAPAISGTAQVGETLTADTSGIADADGLSNVSFSYQWLADGTVIPGATGSGYTLTDSEAGKAIRVRVSFSDDADNQETLTSAATAAVEAVPTPNSPATGQPASTGTAQVGETLTADTSGIADADGMDNATFTYQWLDDAADIAGATSSTYTLAAADEGKTVRVGVSFSDDAGNEETLTSAATAAIEAAVAEAEPTEPPPAPTNLTATVNGDGSVTLNWQAPGDDSITGYRILRRRPSEGENTLLVYVENTGTTAAAWTDTGVTAGTQHVYRVKAINAAGAGEQSNYVNVTPEEPQAEPEAENHPATGAPVISGTAQVGETLTADTSGIADADGLDHAEFSYRWLADDGDIEGAANSTYTLEDADQGKTVRVRVSFSDDAGNGETLTSAATAAVEAAAAEESQEPPPAPANLTATVNADGSVTLNWEAPEDDSVTGYLILRRRPYEGEKTLLVYVADTGSTATAWTDANVTAGTQHVYRVKAINAAGAGEQSNYVNVDP